MIERNTHKMAAGSYQNIFTTNRYILEKKFSVLLKLLYCSHLMTWGAGKFGQLGNGRREDCVQLQDIRQLVPVESGEPIQVSAGCGHSGFVTSKGHAFTCGDNRYGQLGEVSNHKDISIKEGKIYDYVKHAKKLNADFSTRDRSLNSQLLSRVKLSTTE